jgi:hypothetical protein
VHLAGLERLENDPADETSGREEAVLRMRDADLRVLDLDDLGRPDELLVFGFVTDPPLRSFGGDDGDLRGTWRRLLRARRRRQSTGVTWGVS